MYEDYFISTKKNKKRLKHFMTKVLYKYGSEKMTNCLELLFLLPFHWFFWKFYTLGVASKANTKEKVLINMSRISVTIPFYNFTAADTWNRALGRRLPNHSDFLKTTESH